MNNKKTKLPLEMIFSSPSIGDIKISPCGKYISYSMKSSNMNSLMLMNIETNLSKQLTWQPEITGKSVSRAGSYDWSPDSSFIVYIDKKGHLYKINSDGGVPIQLTFDDKVCSAPKISPDNNKILYVAEDKNTSYLACVGTDGEHWSQKIKVNFDFIQDPVWSPNGKMIAWMSYNNPNMPWNNSKIYIGNLNGDYWVIPSLRNSKSPVAVCQPRWSPKGNYFTYFCDVSGYMNLWLTDKEGNNPQIVYEIKKDFVHPSWGSGNVDYAWSEDESCIVFTIIEEGQINLYKYYLENNSTEKITFDGGIYSLLSLHSNNIYGVYEKSNKPRRIISIDLNNKNKKILVSPSIIGIESFELSEAMHIKWKNEKNQTIFGLFYPAKNIKKEPAPLLIFAHGGPTGLVLDKWYVKLQFFANNGWNVLAVNYRGSGGYGKEYQQTLTGEWGVCDVEDCKSGAKYLIKLGKAKKDMIAIMGTSAGGYTTLMSLATHPDFYKAGVSFYGVVDLYELKDKTCRLEAHYNDSLIGTLPEAKTKYKMRSPINLVENITKPLLVLQGEKDSIINIKQTENLIKKLDKFDKIFEYKIYENESHGFSGKAEKDSLKLSLKFLNKYVIDW